MNCLLGILVTTAIVCQTVTPSPSVRTRRGYFHKNSEEQAMDQNPPIDTYIHPPWNEDPPNVVKPQPMRPRGPFDYYDHFENQPGGYGYDSDAGRRPYQPNRRPGYGYGQGNGWWKPTTPSRPVPPPNNQGNKQENIALCIKICPVTPEYNPVCGTNNVTYGNINQLECAQYCGVDVTLREMRPCPILDQVEKQTACLRSCPVTAEFNPLCGTDNVTYSNPGRLECAINCGVPVTLNYVGACSPTKPITITTTTTEIIYNVGAFTAACIRSCPVTSEFNPVCGSDKNTYTNIGRLECARNCGVDVKLTRYTSCEAPLTKEERENNVNLSLTTTESKLDPTTTTTSRPFVNPNEKNESGNNNSEPDNNHDNSNADGNNQEVTNNDRNVTCSDDIINNSNINCSLIENDEDNTGVNETNSEENDNISNEKKNSSSIENVDSNSHDKVNKTTESPIKNNGNKNCEVTNNKKTPSVQEVMECMQTCTLTSESNPVCGTDSITYMNPGRLLCAQFCGVDVQLKKFAPCNSNSVTNVHCLTPCTNPPVTDSPEPVTPPIPSLESCLEACPASDEFKPVCGNNNITYRNLEKLQCARRCGIDVTLKKSDHCSAPEIKPNPNDTAALIQECIQQCSVPQKYEPICGSDNVTYNNTGHLICARQCGREIQVKHSNPCGADTSVSPSSTLSTTSSTTEKVTTVTSVPNNGLNFTIDPSILASIWSETTSTTSKDDDEEFDLDQRVQDG